MVNKFLKNQAFINGRWVVSDSGATYEVRDPGNGVLITSVPHMTGTDTEKAIKAAHTAFKTWKKTSPKHRSDLLKKLLVEVTENADELAALLSSETGKPMVEARSEIDFGNSHLEVNMEEGKRLLGEIFPNINAVSNHTLAIRQPIGVAAIITPWNFPYALPLLGISAALATGCTCVIKPSETTPLSSLAIAAFCEKVGFPKGVINVVTCDRENAGEVGKTLCTSTMVAGLQFTGSTQVGKLLYAQCAPTVKRITLELGGNASLIVFPSADLNLTIQHALAIKFVHNGQICICPNRFYIHKDIIDKFATLVVEAIKSKIVIGHGSKPEVTTGPLATPPQVTKVSTLVDDAIKKGAKVLLGGSIAKEVGAFFYHPTVLMNTNNTMTIFTEEIFGPVIQLIPFETEEEVVEWANSTERGLASYVFSGCMNELCRVGKELEVGIVGLNTTQVASAEVPFGGVKQSGFGKTGSHHALHEFTYLKTLSTNFF